jgi:predicted nucleotidyltransferase component of viral defense system
MDKTYIDAVKLMLHIAPDVFEGNPFALKGGTAINLFFREMPRLSVDLDLVYLSRDMPRPEALKEITAGLQSISQRLEKAGLSTRKVSNTEMGDTKLLVYKDATMVKIEVNTVLRGSIHPVENRPLVRSASKMFVAELSVPVLSEAELYGGKIVAALDRQHPRDFFDVREMFLRDQFDPGVVDCFVCYLAGHNRTVHDVLFSKDKNFSSIFDEQFQGMTARPVSVAELEQARAYLRAALRAGLLDRHKRFLLGLVRLEPDWDLMPFPHLRELPAVKWKILNLEKLRRTNPKRFQLQSAELARYFGEL